MVTALTETAYDENYTVLQGKLKALGFCLYVFQVKV